MKKISNLILMAVAAVVFSACGNSDLYPVIDNGGKASVVINTSALYEELGIVDEMNEFLADSKNYVYATVLVYDHDGKLVTTTTQKSRTLQPMSINAGEIQDGTYTMVALQSAAGDACVWTLTDQANLSTVKVAIADRTLLPSTVALGTTSQTISVSDGQFQATVSPKAAGCIVEGQVENLSEEEGLTALSLLYMADIRGIYLDPARTGGDRLDMVDTSGHRFSQLGDKTTVLSGSLKWKGFALYCADDVKLYIAKYSPDSQEDLFWTLSFGNTELKAGGKYVFYYDFAPQQLFNTYVGTQQGLDAWKTDRAQAPLAIKPFLQFGSNLDGVKDYLKSTYGWWSNMQATDLEFDEDDGFWEAKYGFGSFYAKFYFDSEMGDNYLVSEFLCYNTSITVDMMKSELEREGYTYRGKLVYPDSEEITYSLFMPENNQVEVVLIDWGDGIWSVTYQYPDPDDLQYLVED